MVFSIQLLLLVACCENISNIRKSIGGVACPSQKDASVIVTALTAAPRIKRHIKNHQVKDQHERNNESTMKFTFSHLFRFRLSAPNG